MGNSCCFTNMNNKEKNIYLDSDSFNRRKNDLYTKKSMTNSVKYKSEDNCSILINAFNKDVNYIVSYKESDEKKKEEKKPAEEDDDDDIGLGGLF